MARGSRYGIKRALGGPTIDNNTYIDIAKASLHISDVVPLPTFRVIGSTALGAKVDLPSNIGGGDLMRIINGATDGQIIFNIAGERAIGPFAFTLPGSAGVTVTDATFVSAGFRVGDSVIFTNATSRAFVTEARITSITSGTGTEGLNMTLVRGGALADLSATDDRITSLANARVPEENHIFLLKNTEKYIVLPPNTVAYGLYGTDRDVPQTLVTPIAVEFTTDD